MKKKILLVVIVMLIIVLIIGLMLVFNNKKEKINVYLFCGNGCPHCEHAKEFFNNNSEYNKYYNLIQYEVWYDEDNKKLMNTVKDELDIKATGVPLIVIGEEYFSGYSSSLDKKINDVIISEYEDEKYIDIVKKVK